MKRDQIYEVYLDREDNNVINVTTFRYNVT